MRKHRTDISGRAVDAALPLCRNIKNTDRNDPIQYQLRKQNHVKFGSKTMSSLEVKLCQVWKLNTFLFGYFIEIY